MIQTRPMTPELWFYWGRRLQITKLIREEEDLIVGAGRRADIVVPDPTVSDCHCLLRLENDHTLVRDLNSKNGTVVNGKRITGKATVQSGDIIQLGYITAVFVDNVDQIPEGIADE